MISSEITQQLDRLYDELRILAEAPPIVESEARYQELLGRLRTLENEDAQQLREKLATDLLKSGEVDAALCEARELQTRYENIITVDTAPKQTGTWRWVVELSSMSNND